MTINGIIENRENGVYISVVSYTQFERQEIIDKFYEIVSSFTIADNATSFLIREIDGSDIIFQDGNRNKMFPKTYFNYFVDIFTDGDSISEYMRIMSNSGKNTMAAFFKIESLLKRMYSNRELHHFDIEFLVDGETQMMTQRGKER